MWYHNHCVDDQQVNVRLLLKKVQHPQLQALVEFLKICMNTDPPDNINALLCCNHIEYSVSKLPEYITRNRNISAVGSGSGMKESQQDVTLSYGSIWTWFYPDWLFLTIEKNKFLMKERARCLKRGRVGPKWKGRGKRKNQSKERKMKTEFTQIKCVLKKRNRNILCVESKVYLFYR